MGKIIESAGVHVTIDGFVSAAEVFVESNLKQLFLEIVKALDMTILVGPNFIEVPTEPEVLARSQSTGIFEDEGGITGMCVISKSHISIHCWPLQEFFSMDIFSCGDYDPEAALCIVRQTLGVVSESVNILNRRKPILLRPSVYCIQNTVNGKRYIGKSIDPNSRWGHHVWLSSHPTSDGFGHLHAAIAKYGRDSFTFHVLEVCPTEDVAYRAEVKWIEAYVTTNPARGYNKQTGGVGGFRWSEEKRKSFSENTKGPKNKMYGRTHTAEARAKMSLANMGIKHPARTATHKQAISKARRGEANNMTRLTEQDVLQIRKRAKLGTSQVDLAGMYAVSTATVSRIIRRKVWRYV